MPLKLDLTEKLIEAENVEAMQNVLDLSIGLIGEEKSLYDLALSFLCLGTYVDTWRVVSSLPGRRVAKTSRRSR